MCTCFVYLWQGLERALAPSAQSPPKCRARKIEVWRLAHPAHIRLGCAQPATGAGAVARASLWTRARELMRDSQPRQIFGPGLAQRLALNGPWSYAGGPGFCVWELKRMHVWKAIAALAAAAALAGCSLTLPVHGTSETGDETFIGTATGYIDHSGTLQVASSRGMRCSGTFVYVTSREGRGTFQCENGQGGPFEFVSTGMQGTGTGVIAGRLFTFTFG